MIALLKELIDINKTGTRKMKRSVTHNLWLHKFVYSAARFIAGRYFTKRYEFNYTPYQVKNKPCLFVINHSTGGDQFLCGIQFPEFMRFVASEHVVRNGLGGRLIAFLQNPIPKYKGSQSDETYELIKENLKSGTNVCIAVEGNRSSNGHTGFISSRIGDLVKESTGGMITYRLEGGYLKQPRWGKNLRSGPVTGVVVREYSREELDAMTENQIYEAVKADLFVDEYSRQRNDPVEYIADAPAEYLETALYICPECGSIGTLHSKGSILSCECGFAVTLNYYGFFEGNKLPFDNVYDWDVWQKEQIVERIPQFISQPDIPITTDKEQTLTLLHTSQKPVTGTFTVYPDRFEFTNGNVITVFHVSDISQMAAVDRMTLLFTHNGNYYEVKSSIPRSAFKYIALWRGLTGRKYE